MRPTATQLPALQEKAPKSIREQNHLLLLRIIKLPKLHAKSSTTTDSELRCTRCLEVCVTTDGVASADSASTLVLLHPSTDIRISGLLVIITCGHWICFTLDSPESFCFCTQFSQRPAFVGLPQAGSLRRFLPNNSIHLPHHSALCNVVECFSTG